MKPKCLILLVLFAFVTCATSHHDSPELQALTVSIDQLCRWTGLKRVGRIRSVERWRTADPGYNVRVDLSADGETRHYIVRFDFEQRLLNFMPDPFDVSEAQLGSDTVHDAQTRAVCITAVEKLNTRNPWIKFGQPTIQKLGHYYFVTYVTVSEAELKRRGRRHITFPSIHT